MAIHPGCGSLCRYLDRRAERLVIEAWRRWSMGGPGGGVAGLERTAAFFSDELGPAEGQRLFLAFAAWLETVSAHRDAPAHASPVECPRLCRDECMVLAMIAAAQAADRDSIIAATGRLVEPDGSDAAVAASQRLAAVLSGGGYRLLPVPAAVVRDIADRPARAAYH